MIPRLRTRVGHAGRGDNRFRGHSVADELAGTTDLWSLLALAVGHRRFDAHECALLDDLATCGCAADPRIWPLKAERLASAWGRFAPGLCAGLLATDGIAGTASTPECARTLHSIATELRDGDDDRLAEIVRAKLADRTRPLFGFGVAARDVDERSIAFANCRARRGVAAGPWWTLLHRIAPVVQRERGIAANFTATMAATFLDLGLQPAQIHVFALTVFYPSLLANVHEGAEQRPAILRELPRAAFEYVGPAPRKSPRAGG